jgi:hypothetical protein
LVVFEKPSHSPNLNDHSPHVATDKWVAQR